MKRNIGSIDKILRVVLALLFGILYFTGMITGILGLVLLILGGIFIITGFLGFCPLYTLFGINSCKRN